MILATHGIIGSSIGQVDADALAFFARVTDAGGTLSATEQTAVNTLVIKMKNDGIWTKMKAIYPMVGASSAACSQNLKSSSFTGTFTATGWTFASTGVTPNGTSAFMNTGLKPSDFGQNSISGGSYINSLSASATQRSDTYFGCSNGSYLNGFYLLPISGAGGSDTSKDFSRCNTNSAPGALSWNDCRGFYQMYRTSSSSYIVKRNNTNVTYNISSVSPTANNILIGCLNLNGTRVEYSSNRIALNYFSDGLTDTEASNFYTAVQAFQTTLSRQV